jgi:hypothetical protein
MSRKTAAVLLIGWLLGIATAFVVPSLVWQRQSIPAGQTTEMDQVRRALADGWVVIRVDGVVYTLERPRFRIP